MERKMIDGYPFVKYERTVTDADTSMQQASAFLNRMETRRSVRSFSDKPVAREVIEQILLAASTAPSGAHKQPWTFCVVSDKSLQKKIREAAEIEERKSYGGRMSQEWLDDLAPLGTNEDKPFLEIAPYLIIVFKRSYEYNADGSKHQNYYVQESVGLACGFLLAAIHEAGLVSLTHTPSPMNFLCELLQRPENEKPFLLIPVGYPAEECYVPDLSRKGLDVISVWFE